MPEDVTHFFRLGRLPVVVCVAERDGQFGIGVSVTNRTTFDAEKGKSLAEAGARRRLSLRLDKFALGDGERSAP